MYVQHQLLLNENLTNTFCFVVDSTSEEGQHFYHFYIFDQAGTSAIYDRVEVSQNFLPIRHLARLRLSSDKSLKSTLAVDCLLQAVPTSGVNPLSKDWRKMIASYQQRLAEQQFSTVLSLFGQMLATAHDDAEELLGLIRATEPRSPVNINKLEEMPRRSPYLFQEIHAHQDILDSASYVHSTSPEAFNESVYSVICASPARASGKAVHDAPSCGMKRTRW